MNTNYLIMIILVFSLFTVNTKASTWKKEVKNQIIDETLRFNDKIYVLTHKSKSLIAINPGISINTTGTIGTLNTRNTKYYISALDKEGEIENVISFESTYTFKKAVVNSAGELFILMQSKSRSAASKRIKMMHFDANFNLVQQTDFVLEEAVDFGKLVYEDNYLYLMGIAQESQLVRLVKLSESLNIEWMEELKSFRADVTFLNEAVYDIKVHQQNIYVTFNSSSTIKVIGSPPVNENFSGVVACINSLGDLQWARKVQYSNTNYLASRVLNITDVNDDGIWFVGNVSPLCFEGCPKSVVYKMNLAGDMLTTRSLSPGFYNYINEGKALANGNFVFYGFSNDDVFGPPPSYSKSHLFILDNNLNLLDHLWGNQNQLNTAQLGQGETIFEEMLDFNSQSVVYSTDNFLTRTNLDNTGCTELTESAVYTGSIAFPSTSNIYFNTERLESINSVFSFAFNSNQAQINIDEICFDAGNTRLGKSELDIDWTVSPNPGTDYISLKFSNKSEWPKDASFNIYNTAGEKVMDGALTNDNINIQPLTKGVYFVNVVSANKRYNTIKLVKQ